MRLDRSFQENLGKYNFTARWNIQDTMKRKLFQSKLTMNPLILFVTRLKQFKEQNENSWIIDYKL